MKFIVTLYSIICLSFGAPEIIAEETKYLTVGECVELGLKNNKTLHSSLMEIKAREAEASEANTYRLPSLSFAASYTRLSDIPPFEISPGLPPPSPSTITISEPILDNYNLRLSLQQPLFTGLRLHNRYTMSQHLAASTRSDYQRVKSDLTFEIRQAYWFLFKALKNKEIVDDNVLLMESHLKDIENFYEQGLVTKNEVLKVQVQLSNTKLRQIEAQNATRLAKISLNNLLDLPLGTDIIPVSEADCQVREFADVDALIKQAKRERSEMKMMESRKKAGQAGVNIARAGWFPSLYLTGNYYYSRPNPRIMPAEDEFDDTWDVGVSLTFDIWNWGRTVYQTRKAKAELAQIEDASSRIEDGIELEVTNNYFEFMEARDKVAIAEESVEQAEENYRITNDEFKVGMALNSDLLDAEVALLRAKVEHTQILVDYELAKAKLLKSIGE
ncbi:MAG: hypothetical protein GF315_04250 [candidate division Zixibacteria bacterium]|nr:hypothetical protein [candidate division Zixibacteria bacterium]